MGVAREHILIENRSTNTGENVLFTRRLLAERGLDPARFIVVQKPYMERRSYATFRKVWPEKEIIVTSGGKKTAPSNIETMLKALKPLGNAMVVGDNRNYLVALLALDPEQVPAFAAAKGFPTEVKALAVDKGFLSFLRERIDTEVNARLSQFETIKRFEVLPHDFTVEGEELTSTLKVRRSVVEKKYSAQIDALYS